MSYNMSALGYMWSNITRPCSFVPITGCHVYTAVFNLWVPRCYYKCTRLTHVWVSPWFSQNDVEAVDPRGRTPLHLAVSLGHLESVRVLLRHSAEVTKENANNWTGWSQNWLHNGQRMLWSLGYFLHLSCRCAVLEFMGCLITYSSSHISLHIICY